MTCFECGLPATENHHVVPRSKGGTKTIPLCAECHGKVHGVSRVNISVLTKEALAKKKAQGVRIGALITMDPAAERRIVLLRKIGMGVRLIAKALNEEGYQTSKGGTKWHPSTIAKTLNRLEVKA